MPYEDFSAVSRATPPQSIEAEESVLGGILLDPGAFKRVKGRVFQQDFYVQAHRIIFKALTELAIADQPTDLITLSQKLQDENQFDRVGGVGKLSKLIDGTMSAVNVDKYADLVREKSLKRMMIAAANRIIDTGYDPSATAKEALGTFREMLKSLSEEAHTEEFDLVHISETAAATFNEAEEIYEYRDNPDYRRGIKTGFADIDELSILERGHLVTVAGRTSMGKSTLFNNLAVNIAHQEPVLYFTFGELNAINVTRRLLSLSSQVNYQSIKRGELIQTSAQNDFEKLVDGVDKLASLPLYICDKSLDMDGVRMLVEKWCDINERSPGAILLDYAQIIRPASPNAPEYQRLTQITQDAKYLAADFQTVSFLGCQINREAEHANNKRPSLNQLKGSGAFEEKCQHAWLLYRDEFYNPDTYDKNITEVQIAKNTDGRRETIKLQSELSIFRMSNLQAPRSSSYSAMGA